MTDILRDQVLRVLAAHVGEWIGNGRPDAHCQCGYRGRLGELHSVHVADAVIAALSSVEPDHREEAEDDDVNGFWEYYQSVADAVIAAPGIAVVELPTPDEGRDDWLDGTVFIRWDTPKTVIAIEQDPGTPIYVTPGYARQFAAALLAAAQAAERMPR